MANFMPQVSLDLYDDEQRGLRPRRAIFEDKVGDFYALRARKRGYEVSSVKVAMEMCGLKAGSVGPFTEMGPEDVQEW